MDSHAWPQELIYQPPSWAGDDRRPKLNTVRDISREVMHAIVGIATIGPTQGVVWRGQADIRWPLSSKLGRDASGDRSKVDIDAWLEHEKGMITAARTTGADGAYRLTDLEILARLRHHGARTRLIDCTEDPIIALWFACSDEIDGDTDEHDGLILAIDRQDFTTIEEPWNKSYDQMAATEPDQSGHFVKLPPIDPRISAQRGVFILATAPPSVDASPHSEVPVRRSSTWNDGWETRLATVCGTEHLGNRSGAPVRVFPTLIGVVIPKVVKSHLRSTLSTTYGLSRTTVFPDFAGLGELYSRP